MGCRVEERHQPVVLTAGWGRLKAAWGRLMAGWGMGTALDIHHLPTYCTVKIWQTMSTENSSTNSICFNEWNINLKIKPEFLS